MAATFQILCCYSKSTLFLPLYIKRVLDVIELAAL
jgi:hypothetical protein